jgi:hypothetical protein
MFKAQAQMDAALAKQLEWEAKFVRTSALAEAIASYRYGDHWRASHVIAYVAPHGYCVVSRNVV